MFSRQTLHITILYVLTLDLGCHQLGLRCVVKRSTSILIAFVFLITLFLIDNKIFCSTSRITSSSVNASTSLTTNNSHTYIIAVSLTSVLIVILLAILWIILWRTKKLVGMIDTPNILTICILWKYIRVCM